MTLAKHLTLAVALCLLAFRAEAQIVHQQSLNLDGARIIMAAAMEEAQKLGAPGGAIAIVDRGGHLVHFERLDNTFDASPEISIGKARTATAFQKPTRIFEKLINDGRTTMVTLPDFTPLMGGVPIEVGGQIVGGIGVSGAASAEQDDEIATAGARAGERLTALSAAMPSSGHVSYLERARVDRAFEQGATLAEAIVGAGTDSTSGYRVNASRRDQPGQAEVHQHETDIIYVLSGSATLVTGGRVVDPRAISS